MPICIKCGRMLSKEKELKIHLKYFHKDVIAPGAMPRGISNGVCPECGVTMFYQEGCTTCPSCGHSKCG